MTLVMYSLLFFFQGGPIKRNKMGPRKQSKQTGSRVNCNIGLSLSTLTLSDTANEKVCVGALQAMSAVIMAASSRIQASLHKVSNSFMDKFRHFDFVKLYSHPQNFCRHYKKL